MKARLELRRHNMTSETVVTPIRHKLLAQKLASNMRDRCIGAPCFPDWK